MASPRSELVYDGQTYHLEEESVSQFLRDVRLAIEDGDGFKPVAAKLRHGKDLLVLVSASIPLAVVRAGGSAEPSVTVVP